MGSLVSGTGLGRVVHRLHTVVVALSIAALAGSWREW